MQVNVIASAISRLEKWARNDRTLSNIATYTYITIKRAEAASRGDLCRIRGEGNPMGTRVAARRVKSRPIRVAKETQG